MPRKEPAIEEEVKTAVPRFDPSDAEEAIDCDPQYEFAVDHPSDVVPALPHRSDVGKYQGMGYHVAIGGKDGITRKNGAVDEDGAPMTWHDHTFMVCDADRQARREFRQKAHVRGVRNSLFKNRAANGDGVHGGAIRFMSDGRPRDTNPLPTRA